MLTQVQVCKTRKVVGSSHILDFKVMFVWRTVCLGEDSLQWSAGGKLHQGEGRGGKKVSLVPWSGMKVGANGMIREREN